MVFIFFIIFVVRKANGYIETDTTVAGLSEVKNDRALPNYLPFVFHVIIALLVLVTITPYKIFSEETIALLINDISFQFYSTLLLVIIGLISPFTKLRQETYDKLKMLADTTANSFPKWIITGNNLQIIKITACVAVVLYFFLNNYIQIPALNGSLFSAVTVFLIFFYLLNNIVQLLRDPAQFRRGNMLRLKILFKSIKRAFFIMIGFMILIFISTELMGLDFFKDFNPLIIALLGYNIIMAYNEYNVLKLLHQPGAA